MRLRQFHRRLKKANDIVDIDEIEVTTATITTGTITTATLTTAGITTANITNGVASTKLVIPTTPYTGASVTEGAIYATGAYIYVGRGGSWLSGAGGLG